MRELNRQYRHSVQPGCQQSHPPVEQHAAQHEQQQQRCQVEQPRERPPHQHDLVVMRHVQPAAHHARQEQRQHAVGVAGARLEGVECGDWRY